MTDKRILVKDLPEMPLIAQLIQANLEMSQATSTSLIDSLMKQVADLNATLDAVRCGIRDLMDGQYAPTEAAIVRALWPTAAYVDLFRADGAE